MSPSETENGRSPKDDRLTERLIAALLSQPTLDKAGKACGISKATVCRRLNDPGFLAAYRAARRQAFEGSVSRLIAICGSAVAVLEGLLRASSPSLRLAAARSVLDYASRGVELLDVAERIAALEQRFADSGSDNR
jgi:hypothetical protein